jgi:histidinol-phosphate aminotransferase
MALQTAWLVANRADDFSLDADVAMQAIKENNPDIVFVASPNNPSGRVFRSTSCVACSTP